ncbi:MAG: UDP-phosphate alpha-N-acetylglucosaminyltransferase, partial [Pseudomonadota bacterium]
TNFFNFMDGADGMSSIHSLTIFVMIVVLSYLQETLSLFLSTELLWMIIALIIGFALFNWPRAILFLGDCGAIPIGFLLAFILIDISLSGHVVFALIISFYYWLDPSITLAKRIINKQFFWQAHSCHFYQQALKRRWSHHKLANIMVGFNLLLAILALLSLLQPVGALILAFLATSTLLCYLGGRLS